MKIIYVTLEQIVTIHYDQIERYGGSHGIRDLALLESASFRAQTSFGGEDLYKTIFDKAAAYLHSLIKNHAFVDGNKRTGVVSAIIFLKLNDYNLKVSQTDLLEFAIKIDNEDLSLAEISSWLKKHSKKI